MGLITNLAILILLFYGILFCVFYYITQQAKKRNQKNKEEYFEELENVLRKVFKQ